MSNIIDFLENVGQNASLRYASAGDMQRMLVHSQLDQDIKEAVLAKDQERLTALVGAQNVCCLLVPAQVRCLLVPGINDEDEYYHEQRA
ncbi:MULTISPECIES: hypothetical protein [Rhodanobacter]|uniref:Uncharacterized protein n=2 Tax=Rhodanobacter TaxID=75309 RepID=A0A154QIH9_9GAMM|nr:MULTISPECIES: hypothetical protein [Rhodanobacter]AGG89545.1 hypothetical protein R2APBS1_2456 [Rhodanobacter denitrificans]EIM03931.1 hypothetical protein UUC_05291 [Rhodanobacter denitrificans]KZC20557.1 hypothetical protein RHOFW104R3_25065 [Rhodanobacter denitrificans]KZC24113.1 hypothetical protein RHOFW104T7_10355 [Rhodanobacter thiooxydans]UJJ49743.1 hypothetical protein LRK52_10915 [Rhodanobacter denitrificans]